ncbi:hypothetical protein HDA32_005316 [Spinactinospora alkalitolerans]|uniref:Uncharacterized protein n=1 Tax=Spinactinospora alkalitolerans TaxID=687207 RepID=A0A852U053_9ACTN|nr:hypothetical protein [Spinactinospora alkalitolerans]NYE50196.1 hypothetical protein [Spinactinospora alkalitolerans]
MSGAQTSGPEQSSWGGLRLHLGDGAWVLCHRYPTSKPILYVQAGGVSLTLSPNGHDTPVTTADVAFARDLVAAAQTYLSELERLRASPDAA